MSNSNEQNGRQPPGSQQTAPPTDPRIRNFTPASEQSGICRDYIWGICTKGGQCIFRHERDFESMKSILKFCHDFQNKTGCTRPDCTYLHTTREEENLFLNTGQIPRVLAERYAAMATPVGADTVQQNILFMGDFLGQPPPPPPPPTAMPVGAALQPPLPRAPLPAALLAPPPPPPPPTEAPTTVRAPAPKYTMATPQRASVLTRLNQPPPPLPPAFDRTKPPPPLPQPPNGAQKRPAEPCEAGPSKARKADSKLLDICDSCVQRELRIELYRQEMQKLQCELEYKSMIFDKKMEEYENGRLLLRSIISPELYQILDEYVEGTTPAPGQDILSQFNSSLFGMGSSSKSSLSQILEYLLDENRNGNTRSLFDSTATTSEDTILQSLTALSRTRTSTVDNTSSDLLQTVLKLMRTTPTPASERSSAPEVRPSEVLTMEARASTAAVTNGLHSFVNGQKVERPADVSAPRYSHVGSAPPAYACPAAPAPATYLPYQPAAPPPAARPFFAPAYPPASTNLAPSTTSFSPATRMAVPLATPRATLPAAATNTTNSPQNFNQYLMGRFPPQQSFYPPYQ